MEHRHAAVILSPPVGTSKNVENLLSTPEVAQRLGLAEITLRKWRIAGSGPRFIRCGANVRYRAADIESWVSSRTVGSTSEAA
jgi:predicted DNA-binding transcriptional regulator AlpA